MTHDAKKIAPAVARNRDAVLAVLSDSLSSGVRVLEIASGSGEHIVHFAKAHPKVAFSPSDPQAECRASIDAWVADAGVANVAAAAEIDVTMPWAGDIGAPDLIICINMIHIAPWSATLGLMSGAATSLASGGQLYLYGPFRRNGAHTAASNAEFDESLRARNPDWGVRDLEAVSKCAQANGLALVRTIEMPANNLSVLFRKT